MSAGGPVIPNFGTPSHCIATNGPFCLDWVRAHWSDTLSPALVQHVELTLVAVGIGFAIAFAGALVAHRNRAVEHSLNVVSALLYTIPSLALFQLLVPLTGITLTTIEIALVAYTLVVLFPSVVVGLRSAPPEVLEAARGMGFTPLQLLTRVELPLAVPAIIGGLRVAVVSTISIATIAAFLMPEGLGHPIIFALSEPHPFKTEIYAAGALAVGLALAFDLALLGLRALLAPLDEEGALMLADTFQPGTFIDALRFIADNAGFLAGKAVEQLELSGAALGVALALALPLGVALGHLHRGSTLAIGASIIGRALPSLVLIGAFVTVLGIGFLNNLVALAVLATGPVLTNAYVAVDGVDRDLVEAARAMGMNSAQIVSRVELPLAVPLLLTGVRVAAVTVVATATIAAIDGGGGLGDVIVNQASYRLQGVLGASLCVMALSAAVWLALLALERAATPRGVRAATLRASGNYGEELS